MQFEKGQQFLQQSTFASYNFVDAGEKKGGHNMMLCRNILIHSEKHIMTNDVFWGE